MLFPKCCTLVSNKPLAAGHVGGPAVPPGSPFTGQKSDINLELKTVSVEASGQQAEDAC